MVSSYDTDSDGTDDLFFFEWDVVMTSFTTESYITVVQGSDSWQSEPFIGDSTLLTDLNNNEYLKIEYANIDNAFSLDFSNDITFTIYIPSTLKDYSTEGESSVYDNQSELTKLKETVQRVFIFKTLEIPRYIAETLKLASAMDSFVVNGVSYIREEQPEINPVDGSNFVEFSMTLSDKEYLGVNTHDIGFTASSPISEGEIMILSEDNGSGSVTFTIPAGYLVHTLRAQWVSGTTVGIKLGTSIGGSELMSSYNITTSLTDITVAIHSDIDRDAGADIYATVTGGVANLDLQLIQNTQ